MNYDISQILNFENCNAGITPYIISQAAVAIITENWQNNIDLAEAITNGTFDLAAETVSVNEALAEAGCETRANESDVKAGLDRWIEIESLRGNL
jgi:hypothetical protein